jgi:hypothetical protein
MRCLQQLVYIFAVESIWFKLSEDSNFCIFIL